MEPINEKRVPEESAGVVAGMEVKVSKLRFLMLFIFGLDTIASTLTFSAYPIISDVIEGYYNITSSDVNWTNMIMSLSFVVAFLPSVAMFEKVGLRFGVTAGIAGVAIGFWSLRGSLPTDHFWVILIGQIFVGLSQVCFLTISPRVACVWFGANEVSRACAVGVFCNMIGIGLSCVIPPWVVKSKDNKEELYTQLSYFTYGLAGIATISCVLTLIGFRDFPKNPPSQAQALLRITKGDQKKEFSTTNELFKQLKEILKNRNFILQMLSSGLIFSLGITVNTTLNLIVLKQYPNENKAVGVMGLLLVVCGLPGGIIFGFILDKTHKYKRMSFFVCLGVLLSLSFVTASLYLNIPCLYTACACAGFFMAGYPAVGFELAVELTYPLPELLPSGLISCSGNIISIPLIYLSTWMVANVGVLYTSFVFIAVALLACLCTSLVKADFRRLAANESRETGRIDDLRISGYIPSLPTDYIREHL